jgi:4-amino-4-deoxy-L-arabinose transferase-like glycosyltransferase
LSEPAARAAPAPDRATRLLPWLVVALLTLRLLTLGAYPLMDTSEARYGEIARVMAETGNWVTPQEVPGTPFWAKPPLSTWLSALSVRALGVSEFALRLPGWLCGLGVLGLCLAWARALPRTGAAAPSPWLAPALLAGCAGFFAAAGTVMTDPSLALCTTAMLLCFHQAVLRGQDSALWRYGFFVAAGLGMLAKGPVIGLYVGAPIVLWALWQRRVAATWRGLPWLRGSLLAALLCVPWYALAEQRTPGFLAYFLVGEHFMRFLRPGWGGDLYGTAHAEPLGTIWLYLAGALGVNLLLVPVALARAGRGAAGVPRFGAERRFLLLAALVPVIFFSFAGNIIWTYVLPPLGPLAVLLADLLGPAWSASRAWRRAIAGVLAAAGLALAVLFVGLVPRHVNAHSSAALLEPWQERAQPSDALVYVGRKAPASLRFYSRGAAHPVPDLAQAVAGMRQGEERYLAVAADDAPADAQRLAAVDSSLLVQALGSNADLALLRVRRP